MSDTPASELAAEAKRAAEAYADSLAQYTYDENPRSDHAMKRAQMHAAIDRLLSAIPEAPAPSEPLTDADTRWTRALLTKMPRLDVTWADEVQAAWHRCFDALKGLDDAVAIRSHAASIPPAPPIWEELAAIGKDMPPPALETPEEFAYRAKFFGTPHSTYTPADAIPRAPAVPAPPDTSHLIGLGDTASELPMPSAASPDVMRAALAAVPAPQEPAEPVALKYKFAEGWHIFYADDMPGLYVASRDLEKAVADILPSIRTLARLDGIGASAQAPKEQP